MFGQPAADRLALCIGQQAIETPPVGNSLLRAGVDLAVGGQGVQIALRNDQINPDNRARTGSGGEVVLVAGRWVNSLLAPACTLSKVFWSPGKTLRPLPDLPQVSGNIVATEHFKVQQGLGVTVVLVLIEPGIADQVLRRRWPSVGSDQRPDPCEEVQREETPPPDSRATDHWRPG